MANLNAKAARQQQNVNSTSNAIAKLEKMVKASKDDQFTINGNLVLAQLKNKLHRQMAALQLTLFEQKIQD